MMTVNELEILIHYSISTDRHPRASWPAVREAIEQLLGNDMLFEDSSGNIRPTARGYAHLTQLCAVPWPLWAWVDAHGKEINAP